MCHCLCACFSLSHNNITDASTDQLLHLVSINPSIHTVRWAYIHLLRQLYSWAYWDIIHILNQHCCTFFSGWWRQLSLLWYFFRLFGNKIVDKTDFKKDKQFEIWWRTSQRADQGKTVLCVMIMLEETATWLQDCRARSSGSQAQLW